MNPSRRDVLRMVAGLAATTGGLAVSRTPAAGARALTGAPRTGADPLTDAGVVDAPPAFDGELRVDDAMRALAADDFGHLVHRTPAAVVVAGSHRDVATAVQWAAARRRSVALRGQGHSVYGRSQAGDGLVVDMSALRTVGPPEGDRVTVDAGATWRDVLAVTLPAGTTPPVLTEYLDLSVGGTLVVGGVGAATARHGVQSDNVEELEVVTGEGRAVTCSPRDHADLFDAVRAGLGQVAVITRATIRLVAAPTHVRRFLLSYPDLPALLADSRLLEADGRFASVQGAVLATPAGWRHRLDAVAPFSGGAAPDGGALLAGLSDDRSAAEITTVPYGEYVDRLAAFEAQLRANGQWFHPHPWLTTFVGDTQVEAVVGTELAALDPRDLGPFGQVGVSAFRRDAIRSPLLRLPDDELCHTFNLIRVPASADPAEAVRLVEANRAVFARVAAAGGTLYPVSALPGSRAGWRRHFGPEWDRLRRAKRRYDPDHVLTPGYDVFAPAR
jgi:FAD/FMN-containing dehydrogenase